MKEGSMNLEEFRIRFDELRRMRKLVRVVPLADRLTELVEAYLEAEEHREAAELVSREPLTEHDVAVAKGMIAEYEQSEAPVGDDHFFVAPGVETRTLLAEAAWEIAAHNETQEPFKPITHHDPERVIVSRDSKQYRAGDLHDCGMPMPGAEPVMTKPELPAEDKGEPEKPPAGESDSSRSQDGESAQDKPGLPAEGLDTGQPPADTSDSTKDQDGEPKKPCKDCGETKRLSEFRKSRHTGDGHTSKCKECLNAYDLRRKGWPPALSDGEKDVVKPCRGCGDPKPLPAFGKDVRTPDGRAHTCLDCKRVGARKAVRTRVEKQKATVTELPQPEERLCSSGERCVKADPDDLVPTPAILDAANDHPSGLCRGCQKRAGVA